MNYIIWHAPRTGSNLLCNYLSKLGTAGFASYEDAGFFVGTGPAAGVNWPDKVQAYLDKMRTENGVSGTKASFEYFEDMWPHIRWPGVRFALSQFDRHILLDRHNRVAQAVSFIFASHTKRFTSNAVGLPDSEIPDFDAAYITWAIARLDAYTRRIRLWLEMSGIDYLPVYYEELRDEPLVTLQSVMHYLDLPAPVTVPRPDIEKQNHPLKKQWIRRYLSDTTHLEAIYG